MALQHEEHDFHSLAMQQTDHMSRRSAKRNYCLLCEFEEVGGNHQVR